MDKRTYLKVKIKSLAEEARIIRKETKRARKASIKNGLALHRKGIVRHEARHTYLAYGFLRGLEYRQMEHKAFEAPDWAKVRRMIERYGLHNGYENETWDFTHSEANEFRKEQLKRFDLWVERAQTKVEV
jgi:hypothetical protein